MAGWDAVVCGHNGWVEVCPDAELVVGWVVFSPCGEEPHLF